MPGAVLHVRGKEFDPGSILPTLSLQPYRVYRKGEQVASKGRRSEKSHQSSGFSCLVSSADGLLSAEAKDAIAFLTKHHADLVRLRDLPEVEDMRIDFGYYLRLMDGQFLFQFEFLPAELVRLGGELGIGFELSMYSVAEGNST